MTPLSRVELAALLDLGMADDRVAAYLGVGVEMVAGLRQSHRLDRRDDGTAIMAMRGAARLLIAESRRSADPIHRLGAAARAFELAQRAECEERRLANVASAPRPREAVYDRPGDAAAAALLEKARRWRRRVEEYWAVSEATQTQLARDTYTHLARSYERLAEQFEARAQAPGNSKPARREGAG